MGGGVHLLESYDTTAERVHAWAEQTVGYVSLCKQKAAYVLDLSSRTRNNYWGRVFFFLSLSFFSSSSCLWARSFSARKFRAQKSRNQKFNSLGEYLYLLRFLYFTLYVVIIHLCIMYNIISSLINARVGSALIV